ncbi:BBSome complex assembly protein BBS10 isoform 1-T1 [Odontesthes bonariensis]|uniref:BBSome complex assembly protein BBS10 isoform X1 n=1 Tax=Odontesthes bonariensis TaxID=219752 RepID=UPI003F585831
MDPALQCVSMLSMDRVRLKHVLQTVCALEAVILRSFGPEGGQVLFARDTGQAMLSRCGTRILTALHLEHPLARMVVECVWKHSAATGDGSKTFILLLASLLRMIHITASKKPHVSRCYDSTEAAEAASARHLADKLLAFALTELDDLIAVDVVPYGVCVSLEEFTAETQSPDHTNCRYVQTLLSSFFQTRLSHVHCDFISDLTCELLHYWRFRNDLPSVSLQFLNDNFPALHTPVSGFPVRASRLIEGQVIHRDFATPCPQVNNQPVRAVVFTGYLQPKLLNPGDILELGGVMEERSIVHFSAWMERSLECIFAKLRSFGVSVLLSAVKQSSAVLALATQADMCLVECVSEEELLLFAQLSGTTPVSDCWKINPEHVVTLTFCRPILLGAHRYVHVTFCCSEEKTIVKPCNLVICAPGEGQTDQYARAFQDAIRMLLTTWEPMHMTETTASNRSLQSHNCTSLHTDSLTDSTTCGSSCMKSIQKHVIEPGCVIPAGGTFEFLLHHALLQHGRSCSVSDDTSVDDSVYQLLANALLTVPRQIYSHNPRLFLQTQTRVMSFLPDHSQHLSLVLEQAHNAGPVQTEGPLEDCKLNLHCCRKCDVPSKVCMSNMGLESVSCKYQLLLAVLQCVTSLLRVDTVLHTHAALHKQSHRLTKPSWEGAEDEVED